MQQIHRDNHYVPQLYLKRWAHAGHEGKVLTYRLLVPHENYPLWKAHSPKSIAFHRYLYIYYAAGGETDEFERWLADEFESPAEEALDRVFREQRLTREHWERLVRFAVAQDVRTPARLKEFLARQKESLPALLDKAVQEAVTVMADAASRGVRVASTSSPPADNPFPLNVSITTNEDGSGTLRATTIVGRKSWLWSMRHHLTETIEKISRHRWTILHAPPGVTWPTSDNPFVRLSFVDAAHYDFRGGWGIKNGNFLLPLSPKHLLFATVGERPPLRGTTVDPGLAHLMRKIIIEHADRYIFARDTGDVDLIRPRLVCAETFKAELAAWQTWHEEQTAAETDLLGTP